MVKTQRWARRTIGFLGVAVLAAIFASGAVSRALPTTLLGPYGPDPNQFKNITNPSLPGNFYYYLGDNTDVARSRTVTIPVYQKTATAVNMAIRISQRDNSGDATISYYHTDPDISANRLTRNASGDITVPASAFDDLDEDPSYKVAMLVARVPRKASSSDYVTAAFKIAILSPTGGLVGYSRDSDGGLNDYFAIANRNRCDGGAGCGQFFEYSIPFGKPCNERDDKSSIYIYDGDNVIDSANNQSIQYTKQFTVTLYDDTALPTGSPVVVPRTNSDAASIIKLEMTNETAQFEYNFIKGHKYRLVLRNVYQNNVLQFKLPFDSINYTVDCDRVGSGTMRKSLQLNPDFPAIVFDGDTVTATFNAWIDGASTDVVADATALFWHESSAGLPSYSDAERIDAYRTPWAAGDPYAGGDARITVPKTGTYTKTMTYPAVDATKGDRVCAQWRVKSYSPIVRDSAKTFATRCVYVGFRPRTEVWGNDIRVGSERIGATNRASHVMARVGSTRDGKFIGTWSEYGVFAPYDPAASLKTSTVQYVASGAEIVANPTNNQADWNGLTFANKFSAGMSACANGGCFAAPDAMGIIPDVEGYLRSHGLIVDNVTSQSGTYTISADISDTPDKPRIIIADNINITANVTEVNAWLIARNAINTCSDAPPRLTINTCTKPLRINGPVMAKTLHLQRVGEGKTDRMSVGETINLRGDDYIWAYKKTHENAPYKTTGVRELPPRY